MKNAILKASIQSKYFGKNEPKIIDNVNLDVFEGEIVGLYGHSGCGKSTILRILSGLDTTYEGTVYLQNQLLQSPTQQIGMVVQSDINFGWLSVRDNISFGLRYLDGNLNEDELVLNMAQAVGLSETDLSKYPSSLSGGMKQRMSIGRALITTPKVILLDEPFSALDYESRQDLQALTLKIRREHKVSFVIVSHDPDELVLMCDRVYCLSRFPAQVEKIVDTNLDLSSAQAKEHLRETLRQTLNNK